MSHSTPDLATVLQALASYGQQQQQQHHPQTHHTTQQAGFQPPSQDDRVVGVSSSSSQPQHHSRVKQAYEPTSPAIDPATITSWPLGLRCVAQISSQNPNFKPAIQKMIHDQRQHEQLWSKGLDELVRKHHQHPQQPPHLAEANEAQIAAINEDPAVKAYVGKVYSASAEMHKVMINELKGLGVPFFGTHPDCIDRGSGAQGTGSGNATSKISEEELLGLRRKMVQYLEDMYG